MRGYDSIWIIGDEFVSKSSFEQYAKGETGYMSTHFKVKEMYSSQYMSADQNLLSRLRSAFLKSIQEHVLFPKFVVMVLDDDIIKYFNIGDASMEMAEYSKQLGHLMNSIMTDFDKLLRAQKEYLPPKCKRSLYPQIIWIEPPVHQQFTSNDQ